MSLEDSTAVSVAESGVSMNPDNTFDMIDMGFGTELKYQPDEVKAALMKSGSGTGTGMGGNSSPVGGGEKEILVDQEEDEKVNGHHGEDGGDSTAEEASVKDVGVEMDGSKAD